MSERLTKYNVLFTPLLTIFDGDWSPTVGCEIELRKESEPGVVYRSKEYGLRKCIKVYNDISSAPSLPVNERNDFINKYSWSKEEEL